VFSAALAIVAVGGVLQGVGRATLRPVRDPLSRQQLRPGRTVTSLLVAGLLLALVVFVPLPRSVEADIVFEPAKSTAVFVQTPGVLRWLRPAGSAVQAGDVIARLDDDATVRRLEDLKSQRAQAERRLESARVRRAFDPAASQVIPTLMESLAGVEERLQLAQAAAAELEIRAPNDGLLLPPPNVPERPAGVREAQFWHGTPFDDRNLGCTLQQGTCVAVVASPEERCAMAYISQRRIERVSTGARVRLAVDGRSSAIETGVVIEMSPAPVDELPRELVATHRVPLADANAAGGVRPLEPMYRVRIALDNPALPVAIGMLGTARVRCASASLATRTAEFLAETFRVDL
jgi:putative peptide zinc metalloprotease protein